jgi:hypothetical protein
MVYLNLITLQLKEYLRSLGSKVICLMKQALLYCWVNKLAWWCMEFGYERCVQASVRYDIIHWIETEAIVKYVSHAIYQLSSWIQSSESREISSSKLQTQIAQLDLLARHWIYSMKLVPKYCWYYVCTMVLDYFCVWESKHTAIKKTQAC